MFVIEPEMDPAFNRTITKLKGSTKQQFMKDAKNQLVYNGSIKNKPISTIPNLDKE
jgi:hypothetical protein